MFVWNLSDIKNKTLKNKVIEQNWKCFYCGEYMGVGQHKPTRDHVIPLSKGGETGPSNIVASCLKCNQEKGDKILEG